MILFDPEGSLTILDENKLSTIFFVIVNSFTFSSEGKVYIMSSISSSIIDLNAPRDALVKQFKTLLSMDNVELSFEPDSVEAIANEAYKRKTGARALRSIIEELMLDIMYTLPSEENVKEFTITKKMVDNLFSSKIVKLPSGSKRIIKESA